MNHPLRRLRHHVTGAIERGEKTAIAEVPAEHLLDRIWRYNAVTGYWEYVRDCYKDKTPAWLAIFRGDEPGVAFKAARTRPTKAPKEAA